MSARPGIWAEQAVDGRPAMIAALQRVHDTRELRRLAHAGAKLGLHARPVDRPPLPLG